MGVRGLTSYIARHAEIYLKPYELHDCNLVIDGDCLACNLYRDVTGIYSAFGGDYDDFYRAIVQFFHVLAECNIRAYVLMDGGYEQRKLRTVSKRLRGKIAVIKRINPCASVTLFPLHMKEVFVDAVKDCGVPVMRCIFEADDELAALGRKLNCPVLSYDSDFYIHNVRYIPLITLTVKAHTKHVKANAAAGVGGGERQLRKAEVKNVEKRTKAQKIMSGGIQVSSDNNAEMKSGKTYKYLDCCIYRIEHLCGRNALCETKLPLFAALLGNDYIARSSFKNFFAAGMGKLGRKKNLKQQQRRIKVIIKWLRQETAESALSKILSRLKQHQRESLVAQIDAAISGYSNELCHSYDFFEQYYNQPFKQFAVDNKEQQILDSSDEAESETDSALEDASDSENEIIAENNEDDNKAENVEIEQKPENDVDSDNSEETVDDDEEEEDEENYEIIDKTLLFPKWFLAKLYPAHLSRYFVDLVHLYKYINNPQIEHFPHNDANELALPILNYVFTLLNCVQGAETQPQIDTEGNELPIEYTYLSRKIRVTNIHYTRYGIEKHLLKYPFEPNAPDARHLRVVFEHKMANLDVDLLFNKINELPKDLQLYFLSMVFWLQKSQHYDMLHVHALLICIVVLRTVDATIPAERELKAFHKRFGKIIKKEREVRDKEAAEGIQRSIKPTLLELSIPARIEHIPKSDCYLVQERLLPHFHMQELFKKKYDLYSTIVLHAYAEFQSVVFQLRGLNALLDQPYESPRMGQLYCGVFLYNLYDLLRTRPDVKYYVQHFIFKDSQLMFDFYCFLLDWCTPFVPIWKREQTQSTTSKVANKRVLKKQRQAARKKAAAANESVTVCDPYADSLDPKSAEEDADDFYDLNNKFCALKVR